MKKLLEWEDLDGRNMLLLVIYKFQKEKKKGVCVGGGSVPFCLIYATVLLS